MLWDFHITTLGTAAQHLSFRAATWKTEDVRASAWGRRESNTTTPRTLVRLTRPRVRPVRPVRPPRSPRVETSTAPGISGRTRPTTSRRGPPPFPSPRTHGHIRTLRAHTMPRTDAPRNHFSTHSNPPPIETSKTPQVVLIATASEEGCRVLFRVPCLSTSHLSRPASAGPLNTGTDRGAWAVGAAASLVRNATFSGVVPGLFPAFSSAQDALACAPPPDPLRTPLWAALLHGGAMSPNARGALMPRAMACPPQATGGPGEGRRREGRARARRARLRRPLRCAGGEAKRRPKPQGPHLPSHKANQPLTSPPRHPPPPPLPPPPPITARPVDVGPGGLVRLPVRGQVPPDAGRPVRPLPRPLRPGAPRSPGRIPGYPTPLVASLPSPDMPRGPLTQLSANRAPRHSAQLVAAVQLVNASRTLPVREVLFTARPRVRPPAHHPSAFLSLLY